MTPKDELLIESILASIGLESIVSDKKINKAKKIIKKKFKFK